MVFLLQHKDHFVAVKIQIGGDFWWATVTGYDVYESLEVDIWKESGHFIAKQFGVTNRSNVVFRTSDAAKKPQPSSHKWFSYKSVMPDNGEYDDNLSCGPYCCNFLLNFYIKLGRIDPGFVPDVTSELLWK